jgi:hypothetical protein
MILGIRRIAAVIARVKRRISMSSRFAQSMMPQACATCPDCATRSRHSAGLGTALLETELTPTCGGPVARWGRHGNKDVGLHEKIIWPSSWFIVNINPIDIDPCIEGGAHKAV